jgi:hypothetical protein
MEMQSLWQYGVHQLHQRGIRLQSISPGLSEVRKSGFSMVRRDMSR